MEAIAELKISYGTALGEIGLTSNQGYVALESRMSILKDILRDLGNPNVNMIGVYGMAGVGKTMLVKEVARQAKKDKRIDEVVFVRVSSIPNVEKMQREIADQLGLELCEGTEYERARILCDRLRKERRIFVILDDIWTGLNLESVGIPFGDSYRGCKILLTSRCQNVLVSEMYSHYNYCVGVLDAEEAWSLFKRMLGYRIEEISVAFPVAMECGGFPFAIAIVARALRNNLFVECNDALEKLLSIRRNLKVLDAAPVYASIELSYNYLIDPEVKSVFLLCGLVKHPDDAPIMDLLKYGMALGLFEGTYTMQARRDRVYALVNELKDFCLLLDGCTKDWFSMPDIVGNVAISIASRDHSILTVRDDVPVEWSDWYSLKNCTAFFLHDSNAGALPERMEYPQLTSFCLNPKDPFFQMPSNFFEGMIKLRALVLSKMKLSLLPTSFNLLQNLETLYLDQCLLGDMAVIGSLKKLEILSLSCSDIGQLPREIGQLTQLKLLDLSNCSKLRVIAPDVISSLYRLEELYMGNTNVEWEWEGLDVERSNVSLQELKHLSHLTNLEIQIQDARIIPDGLFSNKLERYKIFIGDEWDWFGKYENARTLKLKLPTDIDLDENARTLKLKLPTDIDLDEIIMQLKGIEDLYFDEFPSIKNILHELEFEGFRELKHLCVQNNSYILCIVDLVALDYCDAFPLLESLFLRNLIHLEKICNGQLTAESFCKLRIINVRNCDKLANIFTLSIVKGLPQLQTIKVIKCEHVKEIFTVGRKDNVGYNGVDKIEFPQLRSLTLKFLPHLTSFCSQEPAKSQKGHKKLIHTWSNEVILDDDLDTSMPFFNKRVALPNLETLELCAISTEKIWHNQLATVSSCIQNLTRLIVHGCDKLKYLFTFSIFRNFVHLQQLEVCYCTSLEEIVAKEGGAEVTATFVFPKVTSLKLWNLSQLRTFYSGINPLEWPSLKKLEVYGCDKVKLFTSEFPCFQEISGEWQLEIPILKALFLVEKVPNLEELKLSGKDVTMMCQGQFLGHFFQKLKILEVVNDKSENFPIGLLWKLHCLEKLELRWSSYKEIFSCAEVKKYAPTLARIKYLKLWELSDLKYMWKQDSELETVFQNLKMLEVWWCGNLINLVPSSASFENLTTLEVWHCKGLRNLVTSSTAKSLVYLIGLRIDGCTMMTEVISKEGDAAEDEIIFSKLKWLSLERLENLTSFCSGNYTFKFPSLEDLFLIECPKMNSFSHRVVSTPRLQEVRQKWGEDKGFWEGDLNTTVQWLHENKLSFYSKGIGDGNVVSPMVQTLDSTLISGQNGEKLNLIKLAPWIEVSSKDVTLDLNLQNKLMSRLIFLDLSKNGIMALPSAISGLSSLVRLDLPMNRLVELPDSIGDLLSLNYLNLGRNQLFFLPSAIGRLVNLKELDLSSNELSLLPDSIGSLRSLKKLNVGMNDIEELPRSIGQWSSLGELWVDFNKLKVLPEAVGKLQMLEVLSVRCNRIKHLPLMMSSLSSLRELDVSSNELKLVPESLCFATAIVKMNLGNNYLDLRFLPRSIGNLEMLEELDISNNEIRVLPNSFRHLTKLHVLHVEDTPLELPPRHVAELGAQAVVQYMADHSKKRTSKTHQIKQKKIWTPKSLFSRFIRRRDI